VIHRFLVAKAHPNEFGLLCFSRSAAAM